MARKDCATCGGSGWMHVEGEVGSHVERCSGCHPPSPHQHLVRAGVPPLEIALLVEPVDDQVERSTTDVLEYCRGDMPDSLLIVGEPGRGKTLLAVRAMDAAWRAHSGWTLGYVNVPMWLSQLRDSFGKDGVTEHDEMQPVLKPDLLVLDDLGAEHLTPWVASVLRLAVNERIDQMRRTIVTTNHSLATIGKLYDERLSSRLGSYRLLPLRGEDLREKYKRLRIEAARTARQKGAAA